jgi:hypothetical protein
LATANEFFAFEKEIFAEEGFEENLNEKVLKFLEKTLLLAI